MGKKVLGARRTFPHTVIKCLFGRQDQAITKEHSRQVECVIIIFLSRDVRDEQKKLGAENWLGWSTLNGGGRICLEDLRAMGNTILRVMESMGGL